MLDKPISNVEVYGIDRAFKSSKYPMSIDVNDCTNTLTQNIKKLAHAKSGSGHDNFLKGIIVQFDLTFTIKAWTEAERYHFFDIVSSQSTMHRISKFELNDDSFSEYTDVKIKERLKELIDAYNRNFPDNITIDKTEENYKKERYLELLYSVPVGLKLTAGMTTNYQQLKTIYFQRNNHRLPEWRTFCEQVKELPWFDYIIL